MFKLAIEALGPEALAVLEVAGAVIGPLALATIMLIGWGRAGHELDEY